MQQVYQPQDTHNKSLISHALKNATISNLSEDFFQFAMFKYTKYLKEDFCQFPLPLL
jgi:hypothetical protein